MVPTSAYVLIYGVPIFTVLFCIALNFIGKKLFGVAKNVTAAGKNESKNTKR